jgi:hypothetical protein
MEPKLKLETVILAIKTDSPPVEKYIVDGVVADALIEAFVGQKEGVSNFLVYSDFSSYDDTYRKQIRVFLRMSHVSTIAIEE